MAERSPLGVWLYGLRVADLTSGRPGEVACRYTAEALDTWPRGTPLISCSLPLGSRPIKQAGPYFRGMLPEGQHLRAMAAMANVATYDTFAMLARFGRDVAGAAVIAPERPVEHPGAARPYALDELADEVGGLEDRPLALYDDSELSLAGLQNKLLLVETANGWARPIGGRPSTHILKLEDRRYSGMVSMEAACLQLAGALGLTTVDARVEQFAGFDCLIVSRFDRRVVGDVVHRIHQEDICQALGRDPEAAQRKGKYEHAGGPSLREVANLLDRHSTDPLAQLRRLVEVVAFTAAIGNADAHGKNLSLLHDEPGRVVLSPLYDTVPTALWPKLPGRAAMAVGSRQLLADVTLTDIAEEASTWPFDRSAAHRAASDTLESLLRALDDNNVPPGLDALVRGRVERMRDS